MKTKMLAITALATAFAIPAFAQSAQTEAAAMPPPSSSVPSAVQSTAQPSAEAITSRVEASDAKPVTEVVTRGANGQPQMVKVNGEDYRVCKGEVQDGCINPRSAGLNFGARDLQYWPGRPASEIDTPLPAEEAVGG